MRLYDKYIVFRANQTSEEGVVKNCFVLKFDSDPVARIAMKSYAMALRARGESGFAEEVLNLIRPFEEEDNRTSCPVCGSTNYTKFTKKYTEQITEEIEAKKEVEIHCVCQDCGNMFMTLT